MTVTIHIADNPQIRLGEIEVVTRPPDAITFQVAGTLSLDERLLSEFAGLRLTPEAVAFSVDDDRTVSVDLRDGATLRLETVDVGVEIPDGDSVPTDIDSVPTDADVPTDVDVPTNGDAVSPDTDAVPTDTDSVSGALAFTVEGVVADVATDDFEALSEGALAPKLITFSVDESLETDGGAPDSVIFEFGVLGYATEIRTDGSIAIGERQEDRHVGSF